MSNIEDIRGTAQNDRLIGDSSDNSLEGGAGIDVLVGGTGKDTYNLAESTPSGDVVFIAAGDSLVTSFDVVSDFKLGVGSNPVTAGVDRLDLPFTSIAADTGDVNGTDFGAVGGHSISNGLIRFSNATNGTPLAITTSNLNDAIHYVQAAITNSNTVAFIADNNTFVFQDGGNSPDTLVELVGVNASGISTDGLAAGAVWIV